VCLYDTELFQTLLKTEVAESIASLIIKFMCFKNTKGMEGIKNPQVVLISAFKNQVREKPQVPGRH
jgi:hypothetical protein